MSTAPRFPAVANDAMTPDQQRFWEEITSGPRGTISGPFLPLMHAPKLARRVEKLGEYLRFDSSLPPAIIELAILVTAHHWKCHYEWHYHARLAAQAGISAQAIECIRTGQAPVGLDAAASVAYDYCREVHLQGEPSQATFQAVAAEFGHQGALELLATNGYYAMLAMILNTSQLMPTEGAAF
jgi:4-carboxymuconolactone decarboxylase